MRQGRSMVTALALALVLLPSCALRAHAQVVRGWVQRADRTPVPDAIVLLRSEAGDVLARTAARADGGFELRPTSTGRMRLEAAHLGFADWETAVFELAPDSDVEVLISLQFEPIPLEEVSVEARRGLTSRWLEDFERRRETRSFGGYFLTEEDIARRPASRPSNLVLQAPGVSVRGSAAAFDLYTIYTGRCPANVYVDGIRIDQGVTSVDEWLVLERIAGVEVYPRSMTAPPQYADPARPECGSVLYWTKAPEPGRGRWTTTKIIALWSAAVGMALLYFAH